MSLVKKLVQSAFKFHGFSLREEAANYLVEQLKPFESNRKELDEWINKVIELVQNLPLEVASVKKEHIELILKDCVRSFSESTETIIQVISAYETPRFSYSIERKKFMPSVGQANSHQLFDSAFHKGFLYRERYTILYHRVSRHEVFAPAILDTGGDKNTKTPLLTVEYLLSSARKIDTCVCLGLLSSFQEGSYFLEDPTGILKLDLSHTVYGAGLYTENCFILVEGTYEDSVFYVKTVALPPAESANKSLTYFNKTNTFGGSSDVSLKSSSRLQKYEQENPDVMMVFVSDVWLDNIEVLRKLSELFRGFVDMPPIAFVFLGNFLSTQYRHQHNQTLKMKFKSLADIIVQYPDLIFKSKFIFVPGPVDCGAGNILPRPTLPQWVTEDFCKIVPSAVFTTNPCRIQYCTKEIVVIREDIVTKMCRNTINFPSTGEIHDHFGRTIICQAHLAPLPLVVCPIYWSFDTALRIFPLPDLIVVGDKFAPFTTRHMDCQVVNPGSFAKSEFCFKVYLPAQQLVEDSQIPNI